MEKREIAGNLFVVRIHEILRSLVEIRLVDIELLAQDLEQPELGLLFNRRATAKS